MSSIEQNMVKYFVVTVLCVPILYGTGMNTALFQQVHTTIYIGKKFMCTGKPVRG
jgi:hypothetical protein